MVEARVSPALISLLVGVVQEAPKCRRSGSNAVLWRWKLKRLLTNSLKEGCLDVAGQKDPPLFLVHELPVGSGGVGQSGSQQPAATTLHFASACPWTAQLLMLGIVHDLLSQPLLLVG